MAYFANPEVGRTPPLNASCPSSGSAQFPHTRSSTATYCEPVPMVAGAPELPRSC